MTLTKADFYFGALLSRLVKSRFAPAIIEGGEKRRIYSLTNDFGEYKIYAKYASKPDVENMGSSRWNFVFSPEEIQEIKKIEDNEKFVFGFVCGIKDLRDSKIVLLSYSEFRKCIGVDFKTPKRRVSVEIEKGSRRFTVYGTGIDRKENPIKVTRGVEKRLKELSKVYA